MSYPQQPQQSLATRSSGNLFDTGVVSTTMNVWWLAWH
jgi:hypothetical protein